MHAHVGHFLPTTTLGRWAIGLALGFFFFSFIWTFAPGGGRLAVLSGIAAGVTALVAVFRRGERGLVVLAAIFPLVAVVAFVLAELLF
jgi:hypothetical protein